MDIVCLSDEETLMTVIMVGIVDMEVDVLSFPLASRLEWVSFFTVAKSLSMFSLNENVTISSNRGYKVDKRSKRVWVKHLGPIANTTRKWYL